MLVRRLAKTASTLSALRKMAGLLTQIKNTASSFANNPLVKNPGKVAVGIAAGVGGVKEMGRAKRGFSPEIHNQLVGQPPQPPGVS